MSVLSNIIPDGFKKIAEGISDIGESLNPLVSDMTADNREIALSLMELGYSNQQIQTFVDVSRNQLDEFLELERAVEKRLSQQEEAKD